MPVEIDIDHVARLARLELSAEEKERLKAQLGLILESAAKVGEVAAAYQQHEGHRADQDQQRDLGDRAGLERLVDELEGDRADQQPGPQRHHHRDHAAAR